jgi:hypothetical protein
MSAILHYLASIVASADGTVPSSTRVAGMLLILTLIVGAFVRLPFGTLSLIASTALLCLGIRDGGPVDTFFKAKVAVAQAAAAPASAAAGAPPAQPLDTSAA